MIPDFKSIEYLEKGNDKQQLAFSILNEYRILEILQNFDPIVVGTIPICIDIESSDLDIICYCKEEEDFIRDLNHFQSNYKFSVRKIDTPNGEAIVCNFIIGEMEFEIFAQKIPTTDQAAYKHMVIEHKILALKDEAFRQEVIALKRQGIKTEPAFAMLLGLEGNPYDALLNVLPD